MYSNIRENRLGGLDADIIVNGETVPYTIPDGLKQIIYNKGDEITKIVKVFDKQGKDTGKTKLIGTGEFEQIPVKEIDVNQDLLDKEALPDSDPDKITIAWLTPADKQTKIDADFLEIEKSFVVLEFDWLDIEIKKHDTGATRTYSTLTKLKNYGNKLRDYIQKGVITTENRPTRPV